MPLDADWIAAHVPQHGAMCLLDGVLEWDASGVACRAYSHRSPANPLRAHGRLGIAAGIEYAAQAMAVHGALLARAAPATPGLLASARSVAFGAERLDEVIGPLTVRARCVHGDAAKETPGMPDVLLTVMTWPAGSDHFTLSAETTRFTV